MARSNSFMSVYREAYSSIGIFPHPFASILPTCWVVSGDEREKKLFVFFIYYFDIFLSSITSCYFSKVVKRVRRVVVLS